MELSNVMFFLAGMVAAFIISIVIEKILLSREEAKLKKAAERTKEMELDAYIESLLHEQAVEGLEKREGKND